MIESKLDALRISAGLVFMAGEFRVCLWDTPEKNCVIYTQEIEGNLWWVLEDTVNGKRQLRLVDEYDGMADMIWDNREYINKSGQLEGRKDKK